MSEIKNLNEKWSGRHIGDEIEAFLKNLIGKCISDINTLTSRLSELFGLLSSVPKFGTKIVDSLPAIGEASRTTVYIVPGENSFDEYMVDGTEESPEWRKIGTQEIDLSEYAKKEDINNIEVLEGLSKDEEGNLWMTKNGKSNPVIHPNLSTQPSLLPYRFGVFPVYEVLCPLRYKYNSYTDFDFSELPDDAVIIGGNIIGIGSGFCVPLIVSRDWAFDNNRGYWLKSKGWIVKNNFGDLPGPTAPSYALVRYYRPVYNEDETDYGYGSGDGYGSGYGSREGDIFWREYANDDYVVDKYGKLLTFNVTDGIVNIYFSKIQNKLFYMNAEGYNPMKDDWGATDVSANGTMEQFTFIINGTTYSFDAENSITPEPGQY